MSTNNLSFTILDGEGCQVWVLDVQGEIRRGQWRGMPARLLGLVDAVDSRGIDLSVESLYANPADAVNRCPVFQDRDGTVWTGERITDVSSSVYYDRDPDRSDAQAVRHFELVLPLAVA